VSANCDRQPDRQTQHTIEKCIRITALTYAVHKNTNNPTGMHDSNNTQIHTALTAIFLGYPVPPCLSTSSIHIGKK